MQDPCRHFRGKRLLIAVDQSPLPTKVLWRLLSYDATIVGTDESLATMLNLVIKGHVDAVIVDLCLEEAAIEAMIAALEAAEIPYVFAWIGEERLVPRDYPGYRFIDDRSALGHIAEALFSART